MIGTDEARRVAAFGLTNGRAAVATHVEEGTDAVGIFADDDDLFAADFEQKIITLILDARDMACDNPFLADHRLIISVEHRVARVKVLGQTVTRAYIRREVRHQITLSH